MADHLVRRTLLYNVAVIHHQHTVAELLHQRNIVTDEQDRKRRSLFPAERVQKLQDLLLDGHVQRRSCLITDQQFRFYGQRPGDRCALALPAADLVRIACSKISAQSAAFKQPRSFCRSFFSGAAAVAKAFANAVAQCAARVKGVGRCLEYHLHLPVGGTQRFSCHSGDVLTVQKDGSGGCIQKPRDEVYRCALAASAFANDAKALARHQVKTDMVDCGQLRLSRAGKCFCQIVNA